MYIIVHTSGKKKEKSAAAAQYRKKIPLKIYFSLTLTYVGNCILCLIKLFLTQLLARCNFPSFFGSLVFNYLHFLVETQIYVTQKYECLTFLVPKHQDPLTYLSNRYSVNTCFQKIIFLNFKISNFQNSSEKWENIKLGTKKYTHNYIIM